MRARGGLLKILERFTEMAPRCRHADVDRKQYANDCCVSVMYYFVTFHVGLLLCVILHVFYVFTFNQHLFFNFSLMCD